MLNLGVFVHYLSIGLYMKSIVNNCHARSRNKYSKDKNKIISNKITKCIY